MMKPKIVFCAYREWALNIYESVKEKYGEKAEIILIKSPEDFNEQINNINPGLIFFVWWSWIIKSDVLNKFKCICLHPSPLPKYRGGSPLQHQIMKGEEKSAVTLFLMSEGIDKGPILWQEEFSLGGDLNEVFGRITEKGDKGISKLVDSYLKGEDMKGEAQDESKSSYFKRRTPDQSEIKLEDFENFTAKELHNKIRALQDPYPNAFVVCKDKTKLYIQKSKAD